MINHCADDGCIMAIETVDKLPQTSIMAIETVDTLLSTIGWFMKKFELRYYRIQEYTIAIVTELKGEQHKN